mgnify:CR=1 FL=1
MSKQLWTSAYEIARVFPGWPPLNDLNRASYLSLVDRLVSAPDAEDAAEILYDANFCGIYALVSGGAFQFARKVREILNIDEPAWKTLTWAPVDCPSKADHIVGAGVASVIGVVANHKDGRWCGYYSEFDWYVDDEEVEAETEDGAKEKMHDAYVLWHLKEIRLAFGEKE